MALSRDSNNVVIQGPLNWSTSQNVTTSGTSALSSQISSGVVVCRLSATTDSWVSQVTSNKGAGAVITGNYRIDTAAISTAGTKYRVGDVLTGPSGQTLTVATLASTTDVLATVAINAAGTGLSNGTRTFTVANGADGVGTSATFTATVSGGIVTAILAIAQVGSYSVDPTTLTGNACTVDTGSTNATFNLTLAQAGPIATASVTTAGSVTAKPINPVSFTGGSLGSSATARFNLTYKLLSLASTGGTDYTPTQALVFTGGTAGTTPIATIATVDVLTGSPATFTISNAGATISVFPTSITAAAATGSATVGGSSIYLPANRVEYISVRSAPYFAVIANSSAGVLNIVECN